MIPSGYKEDTVFSAIPTDGSGDLSFTRASNGTRVNSAGLVEVVAWNAMQYSEDFANAVYAIPNGGSSVVVTSNATTAPNGTTTADKIEIANGANDRIEQINTAPILTTGLPCTFSVYIKSVSGTGKVGIRSGQSGLSAVLSYTNEWQRLTWTFNAYATSEIPQFCNSTLVGGADSAPSFFVWGAQLNIGATAKPYFPTTDRLNVPRLTYQNGGGGCPSLLLEKQSTNLLSYSEDFVNAYWSKFNGTISTNTTTSPDGTQNADSLVSDSGQYGVLYIAAQFTAGQNVTLSIFAKANTSSTIRLGTTDAGIDYSGVFNLSNGTITSSTGVTASIQSMGNGWYRCIINRTMAGSANMFAVEYEGNKSLYIWGAQAEVSSYPTSYIPTTSASATRVADACFKTGISSLIGQTEGVIFYDGVLTGISNPFANLINSEKNTTGSFAIQQGLNNSIAGDIFVGSTRVVAIQGGNFSVGTRTKIAFAYKSGSSALYVNGTQIATSSATFTPIENMDDIYIGDETTYFSYKENTQVNQVALFKTRLTNAELASLTTI
jgi:hypothetical protein